MTCRVVHGQQLTEGFQIHTGVRQGCLLSPFLFLLAIDWIMKKTTEQGKNGIQWTLWTQLEDLDFADDIALLSHTQQQMQAKMDRMAEVAGGVGLRINKGKSTILKNNTNKFDHIILVYEPFEEVTSFTYLENLVKTQG